MTDQPEKNAKRGTATWVKVCGWFFLALFVAAIGWTGFSWAKLKMSEQAFVDLGYPTRYTELVPDPVPLEDNGAEIYEEVVRTLSKLPPSNDNFLHQIRSLSSDRGDLGDDEFFRRFRVLSENAAVSNAVKKANTIPSRSGWLLKNTYPVMNEYPGRSLPQLGQVLNYTAHILLEDGEPVRAWDTWMTNLHIAAVMRNEPLLNTHYSRIELVHRLKETADFLGAHSFPTPEQYDRIQGYLRTFENLDYVENMLHFRRLTHIEKLFQELRSGRDPGHLPALVRWYGFLPPLSYADEAACNRLSLRTIEELALPNHEQAVAKDWFVFLDGIPVLALMAMDEAYAIRYWFDEHVEMLAEVRVLAAGLAVQTFFRTQGRFPSSLGEIEFEKLIDPYDGRPLKFIRSDDLCLIYSIGEDRLDNGGSPVIRRGQGGDIVWTISLEE